MKIRSFCPARITRCGVLFGFVLAALLVSRSEAWEVSTHRAMGRYSGAKLIFAATNANQDLIPIAGANVLRNPTYWNVIEDYLELEDQPPNPVQHFFNPLSNAGLTVGIFPFDHTFRSAADRADDFWGVATTEYRLGNFQTAFSALGRVCHLIQDMGCPAHTLNDAHPDQSLCSPFEPYLDISCSDFVVRTDSLHFYATTAANQVHSLDATMSTGTTIRQIMIDLATRSSQWDSDKACGYGPPGKGSGSLNNLSCPDFSWPNVDIAQADLGRIVADCLPATEQAMARALVIFFATVRPQKPTLTQPEEAKTYSGIAGVPLRVEVNPLAGVSNLRSVRIEFRDNESLLPNQWHLIREVNIVGNTVVDERWFNTVHSGQIKLRAVVVDTAGCESIPALVNIKIDSTPPKILNTRP